MTGLTGFLQKLPHTRVMKSFLKKTRHYPSCRHCDVRVPA